MPLWFNPERLVKVSAYSEAVSPSQHTEVSFSAEVVDLGGYFTAGQPSQIVIPAGLAGWYQVLCTVRWIIPAHVTVAIDPGQEAESYYYSWLRLNGSVLSNEARATANRVTGAKGSSQVMALETHFNVGDVLGLMLWHSFASSYIEQINALSFLGVRRINRINLVSPPIFKARVDEQDLEG